MINFIFDLDDTLYNLAEPFLRAHQDIFGDALKEQCDHLFMVYRKHADEIIQAEMDGRIAPEDAFYVRLSRTYEGTGILIDREISERFDQRYRYYQTCITVPEGIQKMLSWCIENGCTIGVLTNGKIYDQGVKMQALGLERWFEKDQLIVSEEIGALKPDLRAFAYVQKKLGLDLENTWYIGDNYRIDVLGSKAAGWHSVWYNHRGRTTTDGENISDVTVTTAEELLSELQKIVNEHYIREKVHEMYYRYDYNCARTTLVCLGDLLNVKIEQQTWNAAVGLHGGGGFRGQCGLVEGGLMFIGIYFSQLGYEEKKIVSLCYYYAKKFSETFGSLRCFDLRPGGFRKDDPSHLCEQLSCKTIIFTYQFITEHLI